MTRTHSAEPGLLENLIFVGLSIFWLVFLLVGYSKRDPWLFATAALFLILDAIGRAGR